MITQTSQIKINLPLALKDFLVSKAKKYDMPVAGYVKHLIINDVADMDYPVFQMSDRTEKLAKEALEDRKNSIKVTSVSEYFKSL